MAAKTPRRFVTRQSEIKCYRRCRQQHHYRYRMKIQRRRRPKPLVRGTIIHKMVELHSGNKDPFLALKEAEKKWGEMFEEEREEYGDIIGEIRLLMTEYFTWYKSDPLHPIKIGKRWAEHDFEIELAPGINLKGRIDRFSKTRDGRKWLEDTKSHKKLPEGDIVYQDIQTALYLTASPSLGIKPDGIAWNYIRYKAPTVPELLKSGELSRRNIDTTWSVYLSAIKNNKLDPDDYKDMQERLEGKEATFFVRPLLPAHPKLIRRLVDDAVETAKEIRDGKPPVRNIERHCDWCEYKNLCYAELRGFDTKDMMKRDFQEKDDEEELEVA